ncbi:hypothetical protein KUTeg_017308 [Tegillarca granosa]|uniref:Uncharacterized protein n=1 Tax=Tegillarca granosa TaxID=220873 RepID=A0ABQ9EMP2_TEGGR|nr:hypothetical protein KUTeg_017308 [Tegillarca granosa]
MDQLDPPTFPTVETLGTSFPWVENTLGVLRCTTTLGNPREITYGWLLNSQVINGQTTDTYTIPRLTNVDNELHIQCRVSNLYTRNRPPAEVSNITVLDVQCKYLYNTTSITVQEGDNTSRQCSAIGNPTPTVKWYRGSSQQTSGTGTSATLVFSNIDRNQADTYQCKATATGKQNFESTPPDSPSEFSLAENGTRSVKVTWRRGFNGGHAQTFVIRYNKTVTQETKEITIEDTNQSSNYTVEINELEPDTTYNFWIYSKNVKGNSTLSDNLFVQTLKEPERKSQTGSIGAIVGGITGILTAIITIVVIPFLGYTKILPIIWMEEELMTAYEDLDSRIALSDVSTYQKIRTTKIASTVYEKQVFFIKNDISMHEGLDKTQESDSNTYETVTNEKIAEYPKEKVYVNMAIGMAD